MAPLQRSFDGVAPVAPLDTFTERLASWRSPAMLGPMEHLVHPEAPSGLAIGLAAPTTPIRMPEGADLVLPAPSRPSRTPPKVATFIQRLAGGWSQPSAAEPDAATPQLNRQQPPAAVARSRPSTTTPDSVMFEPDLVASAQSPHLLEPEPLPPGSPAVTVTPHSPRIPPKSPPTTQRTSSSSRPTSPLMDLPARAVQRTPGAKHSTRPLMATSRPTVKVSAVAAAVTLPTAEPAPPPRRLNVASTLLADISTVLPEPTPRPLPVVSRLSTPPAIETEQGGGLSGGVDLGSDQPHGLHDDAPSESVDDSGAESTGDAAQPAPVASSSALDSTAPAASHAASGHRPLPLQLAQQTERAGSISGTSTGTGTGTGSARSLQLSLPTDALKVANSTGAPITAASPPSEAPAARPSRPDIPSSIPGLGLQTSMSADNISREIGTESNLGQEPRSQATSPDVQPLVTPAGARQLLPLQQMDRRPTQHRPTSTQQGTPALRCVERSPTHSRALPMSPSSQHDSSGLGGHDIADGAVSGAGMTPSKMGPALRPVARQSRVQRAVLDSPTSATSNPGPMRSPESPIPTTSPLVHMFSSPAATPHGSPESAAATQETPVATAVVAQREATGDGDVTGASPPEAAPGVPSSGAVTAPTMAPGSPPTPGSAGPAPAGASGADIDELARRLFDPLSARLRSELWLDRERAGLSIELRR